MAESETLRKSTIEVIMEAYGDIKADFAGDNTTPEHLDAIVAKINSRRVGVDQQFLVQKELGRDITRADLIKAYKKRKLMKLLDDIEDVMITGWQADNSLATIKSDIVTLVQS